jgi:hypothetical protein
MASPGVILTSQFETQKVFADFLDYQTRANALADKPDRSALEEIELSLVTRSLFNDAAYQRNDFDRGTEVDGKKQEAHHLMTGFDEEFDRYLNYMTRMQALRDKPNRTEKEEQELERVTQGAAQVDLTDPVMPEKKNTLYGAFTADKDVITGKDRIALKEKYRHAQQHGAVLYKDVVSFDTPFLEKLGVYNSATDDLDEKPLLRAGREMMATMVKDEGLKDVTWLGTIHRNTDHIHIHFSAVEAVNTRPLVEREDPKTGEKYVAPRGNRKQATINDMKRVFAATLIDRTQERARIGQLRDGLIADVRESLPQRAMELAALQRVVQRLPGDRRKWQYGYLDRKTQGMLNNFTDYFMDDDDRYHEYKTAVKESEQMDRELFGKTKQDDLHYAANQLADLHKRLGNQILSYIKELDHARNQGDPSLTNVNFSDGYLEKLASAALEAKQRKTAQRATVGLEDAAETAQAREPPKRARYHKPLLYRRDLYAIKRQLSRTMEEEKYSAQRDYERTQRAVEQSRERQ